VPDLLFAGMGAFDSYGRSLNAQFEKRSPWLAPNPNTLTIKACKPIL
jgi:hypothetical protein